MHSTLLHRVASLPVLRELLGAVGGALIALALYTIYHSVGGVFGMLLVAMIVGAAVAIGYRRQRRRDTPMQTVTPAL